MTNRVHEYIQERLRVAAERAGVKRGPAPAVRSDSNDSGLIDLPGLQAYVDAHPIEQMKDWAESYGIEQDLGRILRSLR